jgi:hypothetical protein
LATPVGGTDFNRRGRERRQSWQRACAAHRTAQALDPKNAAFLGFFATTYADLGETRGMLNASDHKRRAQVKAIR